MENKQRGVVNMLFLSVMLGGFVSTSTTVLANSEKTSCFIIERAAIANFGVEKEGDFGRANLRHQIVGGNLTVMAIRIYANANGPPDTQAFEKMTLEVEAFGPVPSDRDKELKLLRSYYSAGSSSEVKNGLYSWTDDPIRKVAVYRSKEGLRLKLHGSFSAKMENFLAKGRYNPIDLKLDCPLLNISVSELTPWIGKVGTESGAFFVRH